MSHTILIATGAAEVRDLGIGRHIGDSFTHLQACRYLAGPEPEIRAAVTGAWFGLLAEYAAGLDDRGPAGKVLYIDDDDGRLAATAVWFDNTGTPPPFDEYPQRLVDLAGQHLPHFQRLDQAFDTHHPTEPHWYLAFLAVRPDLWSHGLGTRLLDHTHSELDHQGLPAYLEATNPQNVALYQRAGYKDMDPFELPVGPATFYRMWRPAT